MPEFEVSDAGFLERDAAARFQRSERVPVQPALADDLSVGGDLLGRVHAQGLPESVVPLRSPSHR